MKGEGGVGEIAQWLSALAALTEDSSSVPSILIIKFHFGGGGWDLIPYSVFCRHAQCAQKVGTYTYM